MKWVELSVDTPREFVEPLSSVFYRYGHGGVAVEEPGGFNPDEGESPASTGWVTVKTYLPLDSTVDERRGYIDLGVRLVAGISPISPLRQTVLEEAQWEKAWKEHLHVLHVGKRTVIVPTWRDYDPRDGDVVIELDPGMAFGTGHHPTTGMCLALLEELVRPGIDVLDVGCGSGILSISAVKMGARSVFGLDIDPVAASVAEANVRNNGVASKITIGEGTLPHPKVKAASYDLAVANISATVVSDLAGELFRAVTPGGVLIASGLVRERSAAVSEQLQSAGARVRSVRTEGDWVTLVAAIPSL